MMEFQIRLSALYEILKLCLHVTFFSQCALFSPLLFSIVSMEKD